MLIPQISVTCPSNHNSKDQFGSSTFKTVNTNLRGEVFTLRKLKGCLKIFQNVLVLVCSSASNVMKD